MDRKNKTPMRAQHVCFAPPVLEAVGFQMTEYGGIACVKVAADRMPKEVFALPALLLVLLVVALQRARLPNIDAVMAP